MASLSHQFYTLVLLLTICRNGLGCEDEPVVTLDSEGSSVHIKVHPESINELNTEEIQITCTPKDLPQGTQDILFMELGKKGERPLVTMKGQTLNQGRDMTNNMQARGQHAKNVSESFLQITIKRPSVDAARVYCCRMFYLDEFGELKMGYVFAGVSIGSTIAFSVGLSHDVHLEQQNKVVYDTVYTNLGGGYDTATGIFTCPQAGIYMFHFHGMSVQDRNIWLKLHHNSNYVASIWGRNGDKYAMAGNSVLLTVAENDQVVVTSVGKTDLYGRPNDVYATFSGHLISRIK